MEEQQPAQPHISARKALSGAGVLYASQLASQFLNFLCQRIILSTLTKEENGNLVFVQAIGSAVFAILVEAGMNNVVLRDFSQNASNKHKLLSSLLQYRIVMSVVSALVVALILSLNATSGFLELSFLFSSMILLSSRSGLIRYALEIPARSTVFVTIVGTTTILDMALFYGLLSSSYFAVTVHNVFLLQIVSSLPSLAILLVYNNQWKYVFSGFHLETMKHLLRESLPGFISVVLIFVHTTIDVLFLNAYAAKSSVGIWGALQSVFNIAGAVFGAIVSVSIPIISREFATNRERATHVIHRILHATTFAVFFISIIGMAASPIIISLLTKNTYADALFYFQFHFIMYIPILLTQIALVVLTSIGEQKRNIPISAIFVVGSILLDYLLIGHLATTGIILIKTILNVCSSALSLWYISKALDNSAFMRMLTKTMAIWLASSCIMIAWANHIALPYSVAVAFVLVALIASAGKFITSFEISLLKKVIGK